MVNFLYFDDIEKPPIEVYNILLLYILINIYIYIYVIIQTN